MAAFHPALASIRDDFDHIVNLMNLKRDNISLASIDQYDQACRDYNSQALKGFENQLLYTQDLPISSYDDQPRTTSCSRPIPPQASTSSSFRPIKPIKKRKKKPYKKPYKKRDTANLTAVHQPCFPWNGGHCSPESVCDAFNCYENHRGRKHHG
ncbi:hypothetical protein DFH28DRAFT_1082195 [Melampsora americana]|nr:hypothetical protein DFH28DRAFT_1082195 [Melampsora americana]